MNLASTIRTVCILTLAAVSSAQAREWTDATGHYKFKGELIASGETMIILQRENKDKDLVAIDVESLSKEDIAYLEKLAEKNANNPEMRTYTTRSGLKVRAAVISYVQRKVEVYRHRGKVYANGFRYENLPGIYRRILPEVINHFENTSLDEKSIAKWVKSLKGQKKVYECDGILVELENGDHYAIPFFLLSDADLKSLQPGFEEWAKEKLDAKSREEYSMRMRANAMAKKKQKAKQLQFAKMHMLLTGVQLGFTDLWEVTLVPPNNRGIPRRVIVPGRNSREATTTALSKFPGYRAGPAREATDRY